MPDFLTNLVNRTLGLAPTVQPLIAPMYAPGPNVPGGPPEGAEVEHDVISYAVAPGDSVRTQPYISAEAASPAGPDQAPARRIEPDVAPEPTLSPAVPEPAQSVRVPEHQTVRREAPRVSPVARRGRVPADKGETTSIAAARPPRVTSKPTNSGKPAPTQPPKREASRTLSAAVPATRQPAGAKPSLAVPQPGGSVAAKPRVAAEAPIAASVEISAARGVSQPAAQVPAAEPVPQERRRLSPEPGRTPEVMQSVVETKTQETQIAPRAVQELSVDMKTKARQLATLPAETPEPPVIHVTIGRVEVKASQPQPPMSKASRRAPKLSLDDYLGLYRRARR